jgi:hypothetical protein
MEKRCMIRDQNRADFEQVGSDLVSRQIKAGLYGRQKRQEALEWLRDQDPESGSDEPRTGSRWLIAVALAVLFLFCVANLVLAMQLNQWISDVRERVAQLGKPTAQSDKQPLSGKDDTAARLDAFMAKMSAATDAVVTELVSHRASIASLVKSVDELKARAAAPPRRSAPGAKAK